MKYCIIPMPKKDYRISPKLHSVFFEYFGKVIYDGIYVGKDSPIPNIDGIRKDVIDGCIEMGVGAMRWPGGCCADHYHWKNGIGSDRPPRIHPIHDPANPVWRMDFGTDEFLRFCELTGAEPIITVNTATGTPEEFLDWFEDWWERLAVALWDAIKTALRLGLIVFSLPVWLVPFVYWFIFVRKKEG